MLAREHPEAIRQMARHGGFGGKYSRLIARNMQSDAPEVVAEARKHLTIESYAAEGEKGLWLLRFPWVNVALIETADSVVLFDAGYTAMGPVLRDVIPTLSDKPLSHIILSHVHIDHAYGALALKEKWPKAQIVANDLWPEMVAKEVRLGASIARYNNQPVSAHPHSIVQLPAADVMFRHTLDLSIGGELLRLHHAPAETEEQIWLEMPSRGAIFTADYYQGFLPNAGNGKRMQRHVSEWADALRAMAETKPRLMLPMHGEALTDGAEIADRLTLTADALDHIADQVVAGLNAGTRQDVIAANIDWPERFANSLHLDPQYNRPVDIGRMVSKRWTGWWDDIPSHFPAVTFEAEAKEAIALAGGILPLMERAYELLPANPAMAARLADWARYGEPINPLALQLTVDVYMARIGEADMPLQESLIYFNAAAEARAMLAQQSLTAEARID
jgi:glyoxylase-like metal-dependent hydrolase (beta-lactamase superfamily II)